MAKHTYMGRYTLQYLKYEQNWKWKLATNDGGGGGCMCFINNRAQGKHLCEHKNASTPMLKVFIHVFVQALLVIEWGQKKRLKKSCTMASESK